MTGRLVAVEREGPARHRVWEGARLFDAGRLAEAETLVRGSTALAELLGDRATDRDLRLLLGRLLEYAGDWDGVQAEAEDLLTPAGRPHAPAVRAAALGLLATALHHQGRVTDGLAATAQGHDLVLGGSGWPMHRLTACMTLSSPLCSALLFEPALDLLALGERISLEERVPAGATLGPSRFAAWRARTEALRGYFVELIGRDREADGYYASAATHAVRALGSAPSGSAHDLRARTLLAVAYQRLRVEPVDRGSLERHLREEPFGRLAVLSALTLASAEARAGDLAVARGRVHAARAEAVRLGETSLAYVATAWIAQLDEAELGVTPAVERWRRLAEHQLLRLWQDRAGRFETLLAARRVDDLSASVDREDARLWEDALTAVGNRRLLQRLLADPGVASRPAAFVDVDAFKSINDRFGHALGDDVLRRIAAVLTAASRSGDIVVRYGGDEFAVLLDEGTDVEVFADRVRTAVARHAWHELREGLAVSVTVGTAAAGPRALSRADRVLRERKAARGKVRLGGFAPAAAERRTGAAFP